jgi:hypothetical protein
MLRPDCRTSQKNNDEKGCDYVAEEGCKFFCYWTFAMLKKDDNTCEYLTKLSTSSNSLVESCKVELAMANKDPTICNYLEPVFKSECYNIFLKTDEKVFKDVSICERIKDEEFSGFVKRSCYFQVAVEKKDPSLCYKSSSSEDYINYCLAKVKSDPSFCENIKDESDRDLCLSSIK